MKTKIRKPKRCQWVEGVMSKGVSSFFTCDSKPEFEVHTLGVCIAHVCGKHSIPITQKGYQIR